MLDISRDLPAQLASQILQLQRHCHGTAILSETDCPSMCKPVKARATRLRARHEQIYPQIMTTSKNRAASHAARRKTESRPQLFCAGKWERLRHWLCPAVCSLRESLQRGSMPVAALDVITAFAVPNPAPPRRVAGFFGSGCSAGRPAEQITQLLRMGKVYFANPFSRRRQPN